MAVYKAVDSEKLDNDLTVIADSIRAKTGKNEALIFPEGFSSAIDGIRTSDGEIGKPYIDTSKIKDFSYFGTSNRLNDYLDNLDTSNGTIFKYMFQNCSKLTIAPQLDTSKGISFYGMYDSCTALVKIIHLDISEGTDCGRIFYGCRALAEIPRLDISKCTSFSYMFYNCATLETVSLTTAKSNLSTNTFQGCTALKNITIGEGWNVNIYLNYSNELTVESLHGMIENLADLTGKTAKTFQIGATNLAKIDDEHLTMLQNKNWNYS